MIVSLAAMKQLAVAFAPAILTSLAFAQENFTPTRITAPIKDRGVYSVATGTWTPVGLSAAFSDQALYNNTAPTGYPFAASPDFGIVDHGRLPSTTSTPITGTADRYSIVCYQISSCSSDPGSVEQISTFFEEYRPCSDIDLPGLSSVASFLATGLPGGTATGGANCWVVAFDLSNTTLTFSMDADGDSVFDGDRNIDSFGWMSSYPTATADNATGPVIAGNCSGGGSTSIPPKGYGTVFAGTPGATNATGLGTNDFFWIDDNANALPIMNENGGCFFFGGCDNPPVNSNPWGGFWLQLLSDRPDSFGTPFCSSRVNKTGQAAVIFGVGTDPNVDLGLVSTPVPNTLGQFFVGPTMLSGTQDSVTGCAALGA